jgi:hypothetical protein
MIGGVTSGGAATAPNGCSNLMIQLEVDQSESNSVIYQALRGRGVSKRQDGGFRLGIAPFSFFPFWVQALLAVWAPINTLSSGAAGSMACP